jgi:hypothetical protein
MLCPVLQTYTAQLVREDQGGLGTVKDLCRSRSLGYERAAGFT